MLMRHCINITFLLCRYTNNANDIGNMQIDCKMQSLRTEIITLLNAYMYGETFYGGTHEKKVNTKIQ